MTPQLATVAIPDGCEIARLELEGDTHIVVLTPVGQVRDLDVFMRPGAPGVFIFPPGEYWPRRRRAKQIGRMLSDRQPVSLLFCGGLLDADVAFHRLRLSRPDQGPESPLRYVSYDGSRGDLLAKAAAAMEADPRSNVTGVMVAVPGGKCVVIVKGAGAAL